LAEKYRTPVILLMDGEVGHMRERVVMPDPDKIVLVERKFAKPNEHIFGSRLIPPMTEFGRGMFVHVTGSTHKEDGMRDVESQEVHERLVTRIYNKIEKNRNKLIRVKKDYLPDAESGVVCYGVTARPAKGAVIKARKEGKKVNYLRLINIWPFPKEVIQELGREVRKIFVPEMNLGQLSREVERFVNCEVISIPKIGGIPHTIDEIYTKIVK
jgi:2-oxoglutarate ferredoxin oxidoreductase subunit alpha